MLPTYNNEYSSQNNKNYNYIPDNYSLGKKQQGIYRRQYVNNSVSHLLPDNNLAPKNY
jgi:hypothetical protein